MADVQNAAEAIAYTREQNVEFLYISFCALPRVMQHVTIPIAQFDEAALQDGMIFEGSSIRGVTAIHESDMKLIPDVTTAYIDPFRACKTLVLNFSIVDPFTNESYGRDPRIVATRAEAYLRSTGIADTVYCGDEAELYTFDDVRFATNQHSSYYHLDSNEPAWNTGRVEAGGRIRNVHAQPNFR